MRKAERYVAKQGRFAVRGQVTKHTTVQWPIPKETNTPFTPTAEHV